MPFKTMQTFPERAPDVQMFFHGLLMLVPDSSGSQCQVGVHRLSVQHKLSVEVRVRGAEPPDPPLLRLGGTLDSQGLSIAVDPPTGNGVSKFVLAEGDLDRFDESNDEKDFRWSVDLQKLDPLQPPILIDQSGISPSIIIKDGLFYTARRTDPAIVNVKLTDPPNPETQLNRVARIIGANIYLDDGERVILKWFGDGSIQTLALPKAKEGNTSLIYFDNSPSLMPSDKPDHSEFVEYFKVVTNATNATERFDLDFDLVGLAAHGTDRAPCMSVVVGG
jgi:hypothetical protein